MYCVASSQRIDVRENNTLTFLLVDHLSSTVGTVNSSGNLGSQTRYTAFGETRGAATTSTDYLYTGQRQEGEIGLYFYNARWYDPALARFIKADTIVPQPGDALAWDRYAYVQNNPVNNTDPTGHEICDEDGNCYINNGWYAAAGKHFSITYTWMKMIQTNYGITIKNGTKVWDTPNLRLMYISLGTVNASLNGNLRSMVSGASITLNKHTGDVGQYNGITHTQPPWGIDFQTTGTQPLRQMNIFHEVGHLLDNVPGTKNVFTHAVASLNKPSWVGNDMKINKDALNSLQIFNDPNYSQVIARQTYSGFGPSEQWADAFANYVAGNIKMSDLDSPGTEMWNFVRESLIPYIGGD